MKIVLQRSTELFLAILLMFGLLSPAQAQAAPQVVPVCGWTGAVGANWSTPGNWSSIPTQPPCPDTGLSNGMTVNLVFPTAALNKGNNNDVANLHVVGMGFQSGGYTLGGNQILLSNTIINLAGVNYISLPIQLTASVEADITGTLHQDSVVSGAFGIAKIGGGTLDLDASNSFSGGVTVSAGKVILSQSQAGGSGALVVENNATLTVASVVSSLANPLTLTGTGSGGLGALHYEGGALNLFGTVTLAAAATLQSTTGTLTLYNAISGTGDLTLDGPSFTLTGSHANTFNGTLIVSDGVLTLNHAPGVVAVPGSLDVRPGLALGSVGVVTQADNQFSTTSQVSLGKNAVFNLDGHSQTVGGIVAWDRPCQILLGGDQNVTLTINTILGPQNYVNCDVAGTGTLLLKGNGMQNFENNDAAAPFNGTMAVEANAAGYLEAFQSTGPLYLHTGGYAGLYAGNKFGSMLVDNAWLMVDMKDPASMSQAGSLILSGASTRAYFSFNAANAGGLEVGSSVELGSAALNVCYYAEYVPGLADTPDNPKWRTLIQKDSAGPVTGTFAGLPEGAQTSLTTCFPGGNTYLLRITYQGGDGNDVVVTRLIQDSLSLQMIPSLPGIGQAVTLQAILSPLEAAYGALPGKKVAFYDGNTLLGEASFSGLTASLSAGPFLGAHSIQARLVGDPNYADASSNTVTFRVGRTVFVPVIKK